MQKVSIATVQGALEAMVKRAKSWKVLTYAERVRLAEALMFGNEPRIHPEMPPDGCCIVVGDSDVRFRVFAVFGSDEALEGFARSMGLALKGQ